MLLYFGLIVVALLLADLSIQIYRIRRERREVHYVAHQDPVQRDNYVFHTVCKACGLTVARFDERGICANCKSEGK